MPKVTFVEKEQKSKRNLIDLRIAKLYPRFIYILQNIHDPRSVIAFLSILLFPFKCFFHK
jgi:hypothetical protein